MTEEETTRAGRRVEVVSGSKIGKMRYRAWDRMSWCLGKRGAIRGGLLPGVDQAGQQELLDFEGAETRLHQPDKPSH